MPQDTQTLDDEHFVMFKERGFNTKEDMSYTQHLNTYLTNYDEKNLYQAALPGDISPFLVYKLSDKEYDLMKIDKEFDRYLNDGRDFVKVGRIEDPYWDNWDSDENHHWAPTIHKLYGSMIPIDEKRQIVNFLSSREADSVWQSKTLTPEGRIAAASVLSGTEHAEDKMAEVTETLDETGKISGRYVVLHNLLRDIKEAEPLIQHFQKTI
jgi:hypothetical protein